LTPEQIAKLLQPYLDAPVAPQVCTQLANYLELILKWNAKVNLTAIRTPEEIVRRHFGESLFVGARLGTCKTLLDFGSGAGFPGIPIQLIRPDVAVTLAEAQNKKAAFLREVIRTLGLSTEVWAARVESMPDTRRFDVVALRAVDNMETAVREAGIRASERVLILGTPQSSLSPILSEHFDVAEQVALPESKDGFLEILRRR
jgi:16S rRNA (guanine527-N7)-methyltransferase